MSLRLDEPALARVRDLAGAAPIWLVGGAVRDALLDLPSRADYDWLLPHGAFQFARAFADAVSGSFVPLDEPRGMARVVIAGAQHDFADLQRPTLESDLLARDLTINAIALDVRSGQVVDPGGGRDDLERRTVRVPSAAVLDDDPLRLLRVFRFAATLDFDIDADTRRAVAERAQRLAEVASERARDEFFKLLAVEQAFPHVHGLAEAGLLGVLLPEVDALHGLLQGSFHHLDVFQHSMMALRMVEVKAVPEAQGVVDLTDFLDADLAGGRRRGTLLKLCALLHDVGKRVSRQVDAETGKVSYKGHDATGAVIVADVAERLKLSRGETRILRTVVGAHLRPLDMPKIEDLSPSEVRQFFRETGDAGLDTLIVSLADSAASRGPANKARVRRDLHRRVAWMLDWYHGEGRKRCVPLLRGDEIAARLGLSGPSIGEAMERLLDAQADGQVTTREEALDWLHKG